MNSVNVGDVFTELDRSSGRTLRIVAVFNRGAELNDDYAVCISRRRITVISQHRLIDPSRFERQLKLHEIVYGR